MEQTIRDEISLIYFSPTNTTKQNCMAIIKGMGIGHTKFINLTKAEVRSTPQEITTSLVMIGIPVYEDRIPPLVRKSLKDLKWATPPLVIINATYGNVGYGIVLQEIAQIIKNKGAKILGVSATLGEHSFSTNQLPISLERPSKEDLQQAREFGKDLQNRLTQNPIPIIELNQIPGKLPFKVKIMPSGIPKIVTKKPEIDPQLCTHCEVCVNLCPTQSIDPTTYHINNKTCIRCFSCVKRCPQGARKIEYRLFPMVKNFMKAALNGEKSPYFQ